MKTIRGNIFTADGRFRPGEVVVENNIIVDVRECDISSEEKRLKIIPGLIDIHMHGAAGIDVCNCEESKLADLVSYERNNGITSICPATMTLEIESLKVICAKIAQGAKGITNIKGIYLEGPFISEKRAGAQNISHIRKPDVKLLKELMEASAGAIKVVTVAPECEGAISFIKEAIKMDEKLIISIAHTEADASTAKKAFEAGAKHVTHLFNAMTPMMHREPGVVGGAADCEDVTVELICDGHHVDPVMIRNAFRLFGKDRIVLISDSMEATGKADGEYMLGDSKVVKLGSQAITKEGALAGSVSNLYECMTNAIRFGVDEAAAILAATRNPARLIGIYKNTGSIEKEKNADILVVDEDYRLLKVIQKEEDIR